MLKDILFICVWVEVFKDNKTTGSTFFYDFGAFLLQCQIFQLRHSCLVLSHNKSMVFSEQPEPCPFFCTARCYLSFLSHTHGNGSLNIAKFHRILKPSISLCQPYIALRPQKRIRRRWNGNFVNLRANQKPGPTNFHIKFRYPILPLPTKT